LTYFLAENPIVAKISYGVSWLYLRAIRTGMTDILPVLYLLLPNADENIVHVSSNSSETSSLQASSCLLTEIHRFVAVLFVDSVQRMIKIAREGSEAKEERGVQDVRVETN
jgi:hypothetical protein